MIVDALAGCVPEPDAFAAGEATTLGRLRGYAEHFKGGIEPARTFAEVQARVDREYEAARERCPTEAEFFGMLDDAGVDLAVIYAERYTTALGVPTAPNQVVSDFVAKAPDRLLGVAGIDPWEPDAVRQIDEAIIEGDLKGVILSPFKQGLDADDARMARVYSRLEQLGVPVFLHTGINWLLDARYDVGHPRYIDRVAGAFPDLKVVALHAGWPWVLDMMMVAWRHRNVYIDISAHRPRHFTVPESGWPPLVYYGNRMLSDRVLFASTWTLLGISPADLIAEIRELPLKDHVIEQWLGGNALRLFNRV
jgi:predicted TIM-barrel fold metal-dependent hydrolase